MLVNARIPRDVVADHPSALHLPEPKPVFQPDKRMAFAPPTGYPLSLGNQRVTAPPPVRQRRAGGAPRACLAQPAAAPSVVRAAGRRRCCTTRRRPEPVSHSLRRCRSMQKPPKPRCRAQEVLHDEGADQVAVNFFGDGTCNVGAPLPRPRISPHAGRCSSRCNQAG